MDKLKLARARESNIYYVSLFLFLLGSQLLINRWLIFVFLALFLVDRSKIFTKEIGVLCLFLLSSYGLLLFRHPEIFSNYSAMVGLAKEAAMVFLVYLMGLSLRGFSRGNASDEKKIFYLLYAFFIAYGLAALYSYITVPGNIRWPSTTVITMLSSNDLLITIPVTTALESRISPTGFWIYYAIKGMPHTHADGSYAVTIVAYFLSELVALLPLLLFGFMSFRKRKFSFVELVILGTLGAFSLFFAIETGRRLTLLIFIALTVYFTFRAVQSMFKKEKTYYSIVIILVTLAILVFGYHLIQESTLMKRIDSRGFSDQRMTYWLIGLKHMWQFPWGGGGAIPIFHGNDPLAHNTWINIGKSYGVLAFVTFIAFFTMHIRYLIRIMHNKKISTFMKNIIAILSFVLFANMMVESTFNVDKSYFFYVIFFPWVPKVLFEPSGQRKHTEKIYRRGKSIDIR